MKGMELCPRCNTNEPHDEFDLCEACMNEMLMGGGSHVFVAYESFFKEIGIVPTEYAQAKLRPERSKRMLCDNCKHLWHMYPDYTSPYGEHACMKLQCDLPFFEIVSECEHFEATEPPSEAAAESKDLGGTHD